MRLVVIATHQYRRERIAGAEVTTPFPDCDRSSTTNRPRLEELSIKRGGVGDRAVTGSAQENSVSCPKPV
jgi:hypothetical protein